MSSVVAGICDAVATELTEQEFSLELPTVTRRWLVRHELRDLGTLHVDVVPVRAAWETATRADDRSEVDTDIVICRRGDMASNDSIDPLAELGEEFIAYFRGLVLTAGSQRVQCIRRAFGDAGDSPVDSSLLQDMRLCLIVVRLTWRIL